MATKTLYLNSAGVGITTSGNLTISGNSFTTSLSGGGSATLYVWIYLESIFGTEDVNISNVVIHCRAYGERKSSIYNKGKMLIGYIAGSFSWAHNTDDIGRGSSNATSYSTSVTSYVSAANCENDGHLRFVPAIQVGNNNRITPEVFHVTDISIVVTYTLPTYTLTVNAETGGTVTGNGTYNVGSVQTITATPNSGYRFVQWQDGNTSASRQITVTGNATYTAVFVPDIPSITSVSITPNPVNAGQGYIISIGVQ